MRLLKITILGLLLGVTVDAFGLVLMAFLFSSDTSGNLWGSIFLVFKNPNWILEEPMLPIIGILAGFFVGVFFRKNSNKPSV